MRREKGKGKNKENKARAHATQLKKEGQPAEGPRVAVGEDKRRDRDRRV